MVGVAQWRCGPGADEQAAKTGPTRTPPVARTDPSHLLMIGRLTAEIGWYLSRVGAWEETLGFHFSSLVPSNSRGGGGDSRTTVLLRQHFSVLHSP